MANPTDSRVLHQLTDPQKRELFARLHAALAHDGSLIISDIALGSTQYWRDRYEELWLRSMLWPRPSGVATERPTDH